MIVLKQNTEHFQLRYNKTFQRPIVKLPLKLSQHYFSLVNYFKIVPEADIYQ